jgi:quercetin dioxygenase-like cupin family protein
MSKTTASPAPIAVGPDEGEALWFVGTLAVVKASGATTGGRVAVVDQVAARGAGSPMHVHRREDEWFYVTEGELAFWVGGSRIAAPAGAFVYGPRDVPHTFEVVSERARFLLVAEPAGFEDFMRAAGEPAASLTLPPPPAEPPDPAVLTALAAEHGIEILGPPGIPD